MCSDANLGLSTTEARRLAYKLAVADNKKCPSSWVQSEMAGEENGIVLLTFPPHCTYKLQPMDQAIFDPVKKPVNTTCDNSMRAHP
nr:unnamed protein product [Callosobruchus analis]